jgi:hypothetical protein
VFDHAQWPICDDIQASTVRPFAPLTRPGNKR